MKGPLDRLHLALGPGVNRDTLVHALYLLRAPRNLVGIIPAARQFRDWRRDYPALGEGVHGASRAATGVLDLIADLQIADEQLTGRVLAGSRHPWTPLRPYTGDSLLTELLLTHAGEGVDPVHYQQAAAWLLWLGQRVHFKTLPLPRFQSYLEGSGPRLLEHKDKHGQHLYQAYLALRQFADPSPEARARLKDLVELLGPMDSGAAGRLTVLAALGRKRLAFDLACRLRQRVTEMWAIPPLELPARVDSVGQTLPSSFFTLLATVFGDDVGLTPPRLRTSAGGGLNRVMSRPEIRQGERLTEILQWVGEGVDVDAGAVVEFIPRDASSPTPARRLKLEDDDPPELTDEPAFTVFLSQGTDFIKGYYAARGLQNAQEYQNARLLWRKSRLSAEAIRQVVALVSRRPDGEQSPLDGQARLAIGLSLLSGRSLDEVARPALCTIPPDAGDPLWIDPDRHRLTVRAGVPRLRRLPEGRLPLCHPTVGTLTLSLPASWRDLTASLAKTKLAPAEKAAEHARTLLRQMDPHLRVTPKSVGEALALELDAQTQGDLAAAEIITARGEVNARNVIHYASYPSAQVEAWWRAAAERLVGPLPPLDDAAPAGAPYVGAPHAFNQSELRRSVTTLRQGTENAARQGKWRFAFNGLGAYLSFWLGLGLAQRRTLSPVPDFILLDDWVLVADKHRSNGTTDRLVPLTPSLRRQIETYLALAADLAIAVPALHPMVQTTGGVGVRLQFVLSETETGETQVVGYSPGLLESRGDLPRLPGNWGRKVARSLTTETPGRIRDAGLGHWVRGRHAWDAMSTLGARQFRQAWLDAQLALEHTLGFEVVDVAGVSPLLRLPSPDPAPTLTLPRKAMPIVVEHAGGLSSGEAALRDTDDGRLEALQAQAEVPGFIPTDAFRAEALDLLRCMVRKHQEAAAEEQARLAEAACAYMRKVFKVPIFAQRPAQGRSSRVVLAGDGLRSLAHFQEKVLPAYTRDLACLPQRPDAQEKGGEEVELGRVVMIGVWRLGLARARLVEAWLDALASQAPVIAQHGNRYIEIRVRSDSGQVFGRTVVLDAFTSAFVTLERPFLASGWLRNWGQEGARKRRARLEKALNAYLAHLDTGMCKVSLASMCAAAAHQILLNGAPVLAAYAEGRLDTEDLGAGEFRRLAGLPPRCPSTAPGAMDRSLPGSWLLGDSRVPPDVAGRVPVLSVLTNHRSPYRSEWIRIARAYRPGSRVDRLLCNFFVWLLEGVGGKGEQKLSTGQKQHVLDRARVVAYALLGFADASEDWTVIDGDTLQRLQEVNNDWVPQRLHNGAWTQFHRFLADTKDHAGFRVEALGAGPSPVSAKILGPAELSRLNDWMGSARSGISDPMARARAKRHVDLMITYGLRRSESAHLRGLDVQGDLCRVQAYGAHGLKTAWAERVLPLAFAPEDVRAWIVEAAGQADSPLIDGAGPPSGPNDFHEALAQTIKAVTRDPSMGAHHLRHTLANSLVLTLLWEAAGLDRMAEAFPWLEGLRIDEQRMQALLGTEGNAGQGLRAVAALLGHAHPSTTLRHYVHVLCIAVRGVLNNIDTLDISRSFENRIRGRSTLKRRVATFQMNLALKSGHEVRGRALNEAIRDWVEVHCQYSGVDIDAAPSAGSSTMDAPGSGVSIDALIGFDRLARIDHALRSANPLLITDEVQRFRGGLRWLRDIPSGKRGSAQRRHVLDDLDETTSVPPALVAGTATQAAVQLCEWLDALLRERPDDFDWLMEKWIQASEKERGRMRLDSAEEVERARRLPCSARVLVEVDTARISRRDRSRNSTPAIQMRIRCADGRGQIITRDTGALRWVLTYVAAGFGGGAKVTGPPAPGANCPA